MQQKIINFQSEAELAKTEIIDLKESQNNLNKEKENLDLQILEKITIKNRVEYNISSMDEINIQIKEAIENLAEEFEIGLSATPIDTDIADTIVDTIQSHINQLASINKEEKTNLTLKKESFNERLESLKTKKIISEQEVISISKSIEASNEKIAKNIKEMSEEDHNVQALKNLFKDLSEYETELENILKTTNKDELKTRIEQNESKIKSLRHSINELQVKNENCLKFKEIEEKMEILNESIKINNVKIRSMYLFCFLLYCRLHCEV